MDITVRQMEIGDLREAFLADREGNGILHLAGDGRPEEILADLFFEYPGLCFTAFLKKKSLGYIGGRLIESGGSGAVRIVLFAVTEGQRGDRAAGVLFERFRNACIERGIMKIFSPVIPGDHPGAELYRRIGFVPDESLKQFYLDADRPEANLNSSRK